jgi:hypothetical protein
MSTPFSITNNTNGARASENASVSDDNNNDSSSGKEAFLAVVQLIVKPSTRKSGLKKLKALEKQPATLTHALAIIQDICTSSGSSRFGDVDLDEAIKLQCVDTLESRVKVLYPKLSIHSQAQFRNDILSMISRGICMPNLCPVVGQVAAAVTKSDYNWAELFQTIAEFGPNGSCAEDSWRFACFLVYEVPIFI